MTENVKRKGRRSKRWTIGLPYLSKRLRKWLYGITVATVPIAVAMGLTTDQDAALYIALAGAILLPGLVLDDSESKELELDQLEGEKLLEYSRGLDDGYDAARGNDQGEKWQN